MKPLSSDQTRRSPRTRLSSLFLAALVALFSLSAFSCSSSPVLLTVDGTSVTESYFNYYVYTVKQTMEKAYGSSFDLTAAIDSQGTTMAAVIKETAYTQLLREFSLMRLARENNLALTSDEQKSVDAGIETTIANMGGKDAYAKYLDTIGIQDSDYRQIVKNINLMTKTTNTLFYNGGKYDLTDEEKAAAVTEYTPEYARVEHIFFSIADSKGSALNAEGKAAQEKKANEVYALAAKGDDFNKLIEEYSNDASGGEHAIYVRSNNTSSGIPSAYLKQAFLLKENEISPVLETSYGYYIIKRLPFDDSFPTTAYSVARDSKLEKVIGETKDKMPVVKNTAYNQYTVK